MSADPRAWVRDEFAALRGELQGIGAKLAALPALEAKLDAYGEGLMALAQAIEVNTERLDMVLGELTAEKPESPIADLLTRIVQLLEAQGGQLDQIAAAMAAAPRG